MPLWTFRDGQHPIALYGESVSHELVYAYYVKVTGM